MEPNSTNPMHLITGLRSVSLQPNGLRAIGSHLDKIGETTDKLFCCVADIASEAAGKIAHKLGHGPQAVACRILQYLERENREVVLNKWYRSPKDAGSFKQLEKDCFTLLKYTLPTEVPETQTNAFRALINLITGYPPIRLIFLRHEMFNCASDLHDSAMALWNRRTEVSEGNWEQFRELAAACLCGNVANILDTAPIEELAKVSPERLNVIDQLLANLSSEKLEIPDRLAIRYLATVLDFATFWKQEHYEAHQLTANQLLKKLILCVNEIGVDSGLQWNGNMELFADTEGIDLLANSVLIGVQVWLRQIGEDEIGLQCWFSDLQAFIELLVRPDAQVLLPKSSGEARKNLERYSRNKWQGGSYWDRCYQ